MNRTKKKYSLQEKKVFVIEVTTLGSVFIILISLLVWIVISPQYTVFFHSAGGNFIISERIYTQKKARKPKNPIRKGYSFVGWFYKGEPFDFHLPIERDVVLEARWRKIEIEA